MKKKTSILMAGAIFMATFSQGAYAYDWEKHHLSSGIEKAINRKILDGNSNLFPNEKTTRAEFASLIVKATGVNKMSTKNFKDVPSTHTYYQDIQKAYESGFISGYSEQEFKPDKYITREEMVIMIYRFIQPISLPRDGSLQFTEFRDANKIQYPYVIKASRQWGILSGYDDNTFRPTDIITKAESIAFIIRSLEKIEKYEKEIAAPSITEGLVTASTLNVRKEPSTNSSIVGKLQKNDKVEIQSSSNGWTSISFLDKTAYVSSSYIKMLNKDPNEVSNGDFKIVMKNGNQATYSSKESALSSFNLLKEESYLLEKNQVINMTNGFARTKDYTLINDVSTGKNITYVMKDTELDVVSIREDDVIVSIGGLTGSVKKKEVLLMPYLTNSELSHYMRSGKYLYHRVYKNGAYESYQVGDSPEFLEDGFPVHSFEGFLLNGKDAYQYFNFLPLRVPTNYSGADLDRFIKATVPTSPLYGYGQVFVDAANKYGLNAMYLLSNAIHESNWGRSDLARNKNNLFGFKAYDASAYDSAASFSSLREGIFYCADYISTRYISPSGVTYNNAILGNKGIGMNLKYASDPYWGQKIAANMNKIDAYLGKKEKNQFKLGKALKGTVVYNLSGTQPSVISTLSNDRIVASTGIVSTNYGYMHKVYSDDLKYKFIYIPVSGFVNMNSY